MSEPTKVKESAHTEAPWRVHTSGSIYAGPRYVATTVGEAEQADENARRIVACVNYCEGVSTAEIEAAPDHLRLRSLLNFMDGDLEKVNTVWKTTESDRDRLRERVAELANALQGVLTDVTTPTEKWAEGSSISIARAILAKERP